MKGVEVVTMGCRLNAFESEVIRQHATAADVENTIIVNTCAVTSEAERQARQTIRRLRRDNPGTRIVISGCAAQIHPERFADMKEVDQVLGNIEKLQPESFVVNGAAETIQVSNIMDVSEMTPVSVQAFGSRVRALVQVQQGCDHRCTFCIIPFGRGNSRSARSEIIVAQIQVLVAAGHQEAVLTGVDISSYGQDLANRSSLGDLVTAILRQVPALPRLRLSSLDPAVVDHALLDVISCEPRLMPHLHLSLQSGNDLILKRMKRRHRRADAVALCAEIRRRRPDVVFGADLIVGFPTETDAMFDDTLALIADCGLTHLHVFPYSPRPGTPAARMPEVPPQVRKERARRLRAAGEDAFSSELDSRVGTHANILAETGGRGYTEHFIPAELSNAVPPGDIVRALISGHDGRRLQTEISG